jgi:hypothetical protein
MKAIWLLILAQIFSTAEAGWRDYVPTEGTFHQARAWVLDHADSSVRQFLFRHLPRLFPVPFVCGLQSGGQSRAIIPPDLEFPADAGAELNCPGLLRLTVKSKTALGVYFDHDVPVVEINGGDADMVFTGKNAILRNGESSLQITKVEGNPTLKLRSIATGTIAYSDQGLIEGNFSASAATKRFYLGTSRGLIAIRSPAYEGVRYIFPGEYFAPLDLALPRSAIGYVAYQQGVDDNIISELRNGIRLAIAWGKFATSAANETIELMVLGPIGQFKCQLFTRSNEERALVKAYEFSASRLGNDFRLKLHPDYAKYLLTAGCTDENHNTFYSNELHPPILPDKNGKAPPLPEQRPPPKPKATSAS